MARANSNTNRNVCEATATSRNVCIATATISGVLKEVYEGKKYNYATIRVDHDYDDYYDLYRVACNKNYILPNDGEYISLRCTMKNYRGEITFKEESAGTQ